MRLDWGRQNRENCYYMTEKYVAEEILLQTLLQRIWGCWGWQYPPRGLHHKSQTWHHNMGQNQREIPHFWAHMSTDDKHWQTAWVQNKQVCTFPHRYLTLAHISHSIRNHKHWPHHTKEPHPLAMQALHKFCKPGIKLGNFKKNISGLSIYSSYHIWLCRSDPLFQEPPFLPPPFPDRLWASL